MRNPGACRLRVDSLERRELLSGATLGHAAVAPYTELTLRGRFVAGQAAVVTFAAKGFPSITATPSLVTATEVVVAVPAFFNPTTGLPSAASASVAVAEPGAGVGRQVVERGLKIASLPKTGLGTGDLLGASSVVADAAIRLAADRFAHIAADNGAGASGQASIDSAGLTIASGLIGDLDGLDALIPSIQQGLVAVSTGAVSGVTLGTYAGRVATADLAGAATLDRIVAGAVAASTGETAYGSGLIRNLDARIAGIEAAGPAAVIAQARGVVDVLGTATGNPVIPAGGQVAGLALGAITAIVAAAEAEGQIIQGALAPGSTPGAADLAMVDQVLDDPALGLSLRAIAANFVPTTPYGVALVDAVGLAEDLAARIDPGIAGSAASRFAGYLAAVPAGQG